MGYSATTWTDEVLSGAERFVILKNSGAAVDAFADLSNCQISLATGVSVTGTAVTAANMNHIETGIAAVETELLALPAWTAVTYQHSWHDTGGLLAPVGYYKDIWGVVHLRGAADGGTSGLVIFALPAGYRPPYNTTFPVIENVSAITGIVKVYTDGTVTSPTGRIYGIQFDSISFRTT